MKKQLFLVAGAVLTFASCQSDSANTGDSQAQIDSAVNARVEELRTQMMLENDSLINAEAQRRADSMIAAMGTGSKTTAAKPKQTAPAPKQTLTPASKPTTNEIATPAPTEKTRNNELTTDEQKKRGNQISVEDQKKRNNQ